MRNPFLKKVHTPKSMLFSKFDELANSFKEICKPWGTDRLPINTIDEIVDRYASDVSVIEDVAIKQLMTDYNNVLIELKKTYRKNAKAVGLKEVPMSVFNIYIDHIKENLAI